MNEPAQPFTDEDRARLRSYAASALSPGDTEAVLSMLAYITNLEGALREIAKTSCLGTARGADSVEWRDHQKIARAALPTSKEGE